MARNAADIAMSDYIRAKAGWKCEICKKPFGPKSPELDCSHLWNRGDSTRSARYDEDNAMAACRSCHEMLSRNKRFHHAIFLQRLGARRYDRLKLLAHTIVKRADVDVRAIAAEYRRRSGAEFGFYRGRGPAISTFVPDEYL